jgi:23S rRNA (pseudouridine1915-N3)-methyltransferase
MRIRLFVRGRIRQDPEGAIVERYLKRLPWPAEVVERPDAGGADFPPADAGVRTVLLDERGQMLDSEAFAARIGQWRDEGVRELRFAIGAADGFSDSDRAGADLLIAFGRMVWPHMLARAMLAEQLWRAASILSGHPYHRSGAA